MKFISTCQECELIQESPRDGHCIRCGSFTVYPKARMPGSTDWKAWLERIKTVAEKPVEVIELTPAQVVSIEGGPDDTQH